MLLDKPLSSLAWSIANNLLSLWIYSASPLALHNALATVQSGKTPINTPGKASKAKPWLTFLTHIYSYHGASCNSLLAVAQSHYLIHFLQPFSYFSQTRMFFPTPSQSSLPSSGFPDHHHLPFWILLLSHSLIICYYIKLYYSIIFSWKYFVFDFMFSWNQRSLMSYMQISSQHIEQHPAFRWSNICCIG